MLIRYAELNDKIEWFRLDCHLPEAGFEEKIRNQQGYVLTEDDKIIGLLRYNLFWDNTPFCTMLFMDSDHRQKGYGKLLMEHWEQDMKSRGYVQPMEMIMIKKEYHEDRRNTGCKPV